MSRHLLAFFCCFLSIAAQAQNNLEAVLSDFNRHKTIDTVKCRLLVNLIDLENDNYKASGYNQLLEKYIPQIKNLDLQKKLYLQTTVLNNKAYFALYESNYQLAFKYYFKALKLAEKNNDVDNLCTIYNSLGSIFFDLNESEKSFAYYKKATSIALKHHKIKRLGIIYNNIGYNLSNTNQLDSAYYYYQKSLNYRRQVGDSLLIMQSIGNIGGYFSRKKEFDKAIDLYTQCMNYELKHRDEIGAFSSAGNIASIYYQKGNIKKAEMYSEKSLALAQKNNYYYGVFMACEQLETIYSKRNKLSKVIEVLNLKARAKDSLNESESKEALYKAEFKHETEKKDHEITQIQQAQKITELENKRHKTLLVLVLFSVAIALIMGYLLFKRYKTNQQNQLLKIQLAETQKTLEAEKKSVQSELKALRSQMNPHFIFNALNSIQEQFMYGNRELANEQMGNFTALTRQILEISRKKYISIATEVDVLTKYLELEKMRFADDFSYEITLTEDVDEDYHQIPPMLVQPLVENSIKHGLLHKSGSKKVKICFDYDEVENTLICTVEDNGIGREKASVIKENNAKTHQSFATQATEQTLELLEGQKSSLYYEDLTQAGEAAGTRVTLKISLA